MVSVTNAASQQAARVPIVVKQQRESLLAISYPNNLDREHSSDLLQLEVFFAVKHDFITLPDRATLMSAGWIVLLLFNLRSSKYCFFFANFALPMINTSFTILSDVPTQLIFYLYDELHLSESPVLIP